MKSLQSIVKLPTSNLLDNSLQQASEIDEAISTALDNESLLNQYDEVISANTVSSKLSLNINNLD